MFFLGTTFLGLAETSEPSPTCVDDINYIELKNGVYDDLYMTRNTDMVIDTEIPDEWDVDTILHAKFDGTTSAGNVDWNPDNTTHLVVKRRAKGTYDWLDIKVQEIHEHADLNFSGEDKFARANTEYEYALVPYFHGDIGNYGITSVLSEFSMLYLIGTDKTIPIIDTDGYVDTTRNIKGASVERLNFKYPVFFTNSIANYDTGSVKGMAYETKDEESGCQTYENSPNYDYQKSYMDFLTDGRPKVLKHFDGREWLIQVTPSPTDSADTSYDIRHIEFQWVEIGDTMSNEDLYNAGLLNVPEDWWNV